MLELYKNIKKFRTQNGLTQEELAKKVGYSNRSIIAKIESGGVDLSESKIKAFAEALNTTPSELMGWNEEESEYYIDDAARDFAEFLHKNPNYKVLFDASRKVKLEDIEVVKSILDRFGGES